MGLFTEKEKEHLQRQPLGRLATSGKTGMPHVVPTGFHLDPETESIKIGGHAYRDQDRLYIRHLRVNPKPRSSSTISSQIRHGHPAV